MLLKAPNVVMNLSLFTLPGYSLYLNFDSDNYNSNSGIRGVGIFVSKRVKASQVYFNPSALMDQVWVSIKLKGSDSLLVGCVYHSQSHPLNSNITSLCELFISLENYTHLLVCGDLNFKEIVWLDLSGSSRNSHIEPFLDDLFLFLHDSNPTRFSQNATPNLLDLVFTNEKDMVTTCPIYHL